MKLQDSPAVVQEIANEMKKLYYGEPSGHDWWHIFRVWKLAKHLAREEGADETTVEIAALLHEVHDHKIFQPPLVDLKKYLKQKNIHPETSKKIQTIISEISFKGTSVETPVSSLESACVQDADRLDAMGAIGIARAFTYGGYHRQLIFDPEILPSPSQSFEEYKKSATTTINHFYEKLLTLYNRLQTSTGKLYGKKRHDILITYLDQFKKEWNLES